MENKDDRFYANNGIDLFEDYENIPEKVQNILDNYAEKFGDDLGDMDYKDMADMLNEVNEVGYTFEYYLDNQPYDLRPIGTKGKSEFYAKGSTIKGGKDIGVLDYVYVKTENNNLGIVLEKTQMGGDLYYVATYYGKPREKRGHYRKSDLTLAKNNETRFYAKGSTIKGGGIGEAAKRLRDKYKGTSDYEDVASTSDSLKFIKNHISIGNIEQTADLAGTIRTEILFDNKLVGYYDVDRNADSYIYPISKEKTKNTKGAFVKKSVENKNTLSKDTGWKTHKYFVFSNYEFSIDIDVFEDEIRDMIRNKKYANGGGVEKENAEMVLNNNKQIKHHTEELSEIMKDKPKVPAWVVSKVNRSASDLSDATHYLDGEKMAEGANIDGVQSPYFPASESCETLDTLVPTAMAQEQKNFNLHLKSYIQNKYKLTVEQYVAKKLHYKSVEDLCYSPELDSAGRKIVRFGREQIDAIATAIYSYEEKNDAIIIADQTGVGKGRTAAGLIRYSITELKKVPFFFTEKKHLINDIYRDLIDIGFDAGIIEKKLQVETITKEEWSDEEIIKIILSDLKENEDVSVDYSFEDLEPNRLKDFYKIKETEEDYDKVQEVMYDLVELYRQDFVENGYKIKKYIDVPLATQSKQLEEAAKQGKMKLTPFFPNRENIVDKDGNIIYSKMTDDELKSAMGYEKGIKGWSYDYEQDVSKLELPVKYQLFVMSYSQVASLYEDVKKTGGRRVIHPKIRFFEKFATGSVLILDESHSASGGTVEKPSNIFTTLSNFIERSAMTTYISATYSKRAINMPLYAIKTSIRESGLSTKELIETFIAGDTALQEAVSVELVRNGQLLRRERMIQGSSEYYTVSDSEGDAIGTQQRLRMDRVATLFEDVRNFQTDVTNIVKAFKSSLPERLSPTEPIEGTKDEVDKARSINALTFQMFNFFLLGLKIEQTTGFAIAKLRNGIKPVITIANTMESALSNMPINFMTMKDDGKYKIGDTITNDFKLYIAYLLFYTMRWKKNIETIADDGQRVISTKTICVFDDDHDLSKEIKDLLETKYRNSLSKILNSDTGVSIAPIDEIKKRIKDAGFSINEITGRQLQVNFTGDNFDSGVIAKRDIKDTTVVVREFNENKIDALIINQSGAVGISMHARPVGEAKIFYPTNKQEIVVEGVKKEIESGWPTTLENKEEVKKRSMIVTQMELDINKEVQKLGRINRTGQVYPPEFTYIVSAIPSESRISALMERKLRSLSANVSSNQEQTSYLFQADDFFSDIAIEPFNETMKDLGRRIKIERKEQIRDFTKALYFYDFQFQKDFYDTFSARLNAEIQRLDSMGLFNGKLSKKDYKAQTVSKFPFYLGDENAKTSFGGHSFLEKATTVEYKEKNAERQIKNAISNRLVLKGVGETADGLGYDKIYDDIVSYQIDANALVDRFAKNKRESQLKMIAGVSQEIKDLEKNVEDLKNELHKKFDSITNIPETEEQKKVLKYRPLGKAKEIFDLEDDVKKVKSAISSVKDKITEAANSGDIESLTKLGAEMSKLKEEDALLNEKLSSYGDVSELKSQFRNSEREIKQKENTIKNLKERKESYEEKMSDYASLIDKTKSFINKIGEVHELSYLEENKIYTDEYGDVQMDVQKYEYKEVFSEPVVVTGIVFPFDEEDFIPSQVNVHFTGVTATATQNFAMSQIFREISFEDRTIKGRKSIIKLDLISNSYKEDVWNEIAGKLDTSYTEPKWFVVGSTLKTFMLSKQNSLNGTITKFSMSDNSDRLGIEIIDKKGIDGNPQKTTYTELDSRYNDESALQYPIYFDGNTRNIDILMTKYLYWHCIARFYDAQLNNKEIAGNYYGNKLPYDSKFLFEISSATGFAGIIIDLDDTIKDFNNKIVAKFFEGNQIQEPQMSIEDFVTHLSVEMITTSMNYAEGFAVFLNNLGEEITSDNLELTKKSDLFSNVQTWGNKKRYYRVSGGDLFKYIFPTNIIQMQQQMYGGGIQYNHKVKMSYENFITITNLLSEMNQKPTFAIGSKYFKEVADMYVLQQFVENVNETENIGGEVMFNPAIEGELMEAIDSQIQKIVDIFTLEE